MLVSLCMVASDTICLIKSHRKIKVNFFLKTRKNLVKLCRFFYESGWQTSTWYLNAMKQHNYVTSTSNSPLILTFKSFWTGKRQETYIYVSIFFSRSVEIVWKCVGFSMKVFDKLPFGIWAKWSDTITSRLLHIWHLYSHSSLFWRGKETRS